MRSLISCAVGASLFMLASCGSSSSDSPATTPPPVTPVADIAISTALKVGTSNYQATTVVPIAQGSGGSGKLQVRLASAPTAAVTVTVARTAGDPDQVIYNLATHTTSDSLPLTFDATNWDAWQQVYLVTLTDTNGSAGQSTFTVSGGSSDHLTATSVKAFPTLTADTTITGTLTRQGFVARAVDFTATVSDIAFTLSWRKVGSGTSARYFGTWTDNDPLNQLPGTTTGNEARAAVTYPAYGFWHGGKLNIVTAKSVLTQRSTSETNLILLKADDETFASGTGWLTATGSASSIIGSYATSFTGTVAATPGQLTGLLPLSSTPDYPVFSSSLQSQTYTPGTVSAVNGHWTLARNATYKYLVDGTATDSGGAAAGTVSGMVTGGYDGLGRPNLLGVLENSSGLYLFGTPFYQAANPADTTFPFGSLGGRFINAADGTSDRLFVFLSFPSG